MSIVYAPGDTSKTIVIAIGDTSSSTGAGLTGLVYNSAGLTAYYKRSNAASAVSISLANATLGAFTSGGFKEVSAANMPGQYEFGIPDAALAAGAEWVSLHFKGATNMGQTNVRLLLNSGLAVARTVVDGTMPTNTIGKRLSALGDPDGTAQAGSSTTITLAASASNTDNYYRRMGIGIIRGTGAQQFRIIEGYVGSTKVATVGKAWVTNPDATSEYIFTPVPPFLDAIVETEGTITLQQALSLMLSATVGENPAPGTRETPNGNATRISASVSTTGVRSAITVTPSN